MICGSSDVEISLWFGALMSAQLQGHGLIPSINIVFRYENITFQLVEVILCSGLAQRFSEGLVIREGFCMSVCICVSMVF